MRYTKVDKYITTRHYRGKALARFAESAGNYSHKDPIKKSIERHADKEFFRTNVQLRKSTARTDALQAKKRKLERKYDSD